MKKLSNTVLNELQTIHRFSQSRRRSLLRLLYLPCACLAQCLNSVFNVKAVGAFTVIMKTNGLFAALVKKSDLGNTMLVDAGKFSGLRARAEERVR